MLLAYCKRHHGYEDAFAAEVREAFHKTFYNASTASYGHNDGANVSALAMGVPDEFREGVVASLEKDIRDNGGHLNTGYSERSFSSGSFATAALPLYFNTSFIEASAIVRSLCYLTPNFDFRLQIIHNEKRYFRYQSLLIVRQSMRFERCLQVTKAQCFT